MSEMIERAQRVARRAHAGQVDKVGAAYIEHPRRVAQRVRGYAAPQDLESTRAVAWLHDVVEDTPVSLEDLERDFPAEVVAGVDAMTRREAEAPEEYYARVRADRLLEDNTDPARTARLDEPTRERLAQKYRHARALLEEGR